jgi:copper chaperone CopZ
MGTLELKIEGMNCDGCAKRIQSLLTKTSGIQQVSVSFETGKGSVSYRPQTTSEDQIIAVVEGAGFSAAKV